jgi:capsular exopolysaccharide synthesis family protein
MPNNDPLDIPPQHEPMAPGSISDLHGLIRWLLDKSWLILSCMVLALIVAAVYVERAPRIYEAVTTVQVEQEDAKVIKEEQVVSEDLRSLDVLNTVTEKLSNEALLEQVLETNNLLPLQGDIVTNGSKIFTRGEILSQFQKAVKVTLRRNTRLIDIAVRNADPQMAVRLANSVVENYLGQDALAQLTTTAGANTFLQQEANELEKKLETAEQALQDYREQVGSVSLEQGQDIITPQLQQISTAVAEQEANFALIRQRYREKNPKYILAASSLAALKAELQEAESNSMQLSESAVRFNTLNREVQSDSALYDSVISRLGETSVAELIAPERIHVVQPAMLPELPASPKIKLIFALALFGGLAAGLGISFVLHSLDTSIRTVDEAEHHLALPVLGAIPKLPLTGNKNNLVVTEGSASVGAEAFRSLRTTISMLGPQKDRKIYLFTSSLPGEGKTFTSINFAVSLAQQGLRTLLVDIDLRRPTIGKFFPVENSDMPGVTDYFLGRKKLDEICQQHKDISNFSWITAGTMVPNPSELLSQSDFQQFLNDGLAHYDRIVIDTAPLLPVKDTLLLAGKVQTVVLVVQGCKTSRKIAERSVQLLKTANAPLGGVVLNLLPKRSLNSYYYYGYGYEQYGQEESKDKRAKVAI